MRWAHRQIDLAVMATKTDAQRITDTLNFLQNTGLVPLAERTPAFQLAQGYVNAAHGNPLAPTYHQFSQSLSLGYHVFADPNQQRMAVRAVFLLWKAMKHYNGFFTLPKANVGQIVQATASDLLVQYIRKARCVYETLNGGVGGAARVLQVFQLNPLQFLTHNKMIVHGSAAYGGGARNIQGCSFEYDPVKDGYKFVVTGGAGNGKAVINVESVTAFHWANARYIAPPPPPHNITTANFQNMTGIELSGVNIMVTTQFTGCSFCMAEHGGHMYCAHVSPHVTGLAPSTTGPILANRLLVPGNAAFGNAGGTAVRVFGRTAGSPPHANGYECGHGHGSTDYMTIVGVPGGATYEIFTQTTTGGVNRGAKKIF